MESARILFDLHRPDVTNFASIYFLVFLVVSITLYYLFKKSSLVLLVLSIIFYSLYSLKMTYLILGLGIINYTGGILISKRKSKLIFVFTIMLDIFILFYFKYFNFFIENLNSINVLPEFNTLTYLVIPLGVSFFTFELIHYIVDVYKGKSPIKNPVIFLNFVFFFPTLFAGPIKRFENFSQQFKKGKRKTDFYASILLITRGLVKKIVFASMLSNFAEYGFSHTSNSLIILVGVYAFSLQIYFDFSGYTDIARGSAGLFGFSIPENFMMPYFSKSIHEFWRRWHMSLMAWIRDYIYIPLGGSRKGKLRQALNLLVVFLASGLWHGAAWHFVVWGLYHWVLMIFEIVTRPMKLPKLSTFVKDIITLVITFNLVTFGWILFRSESLEKALGIMRNILQFPSYKSVSSDLLIKLFELSILLGFYLVMPRLLKRLNGLYYFFARAFIYGIAIVLVFLMMPHDAISFIYFQF